MTWEMPMDVARRVMEFVKEDPMIEDNKETLPSTRRCWMGSWDSPGLG
jgi:hypothetical protein